MKMKKTICTILCALSIMCAFTACSGDKNSSDTSSATSQTTASEKTESKDVSAIADKLKSDIKFDDELVELNKEKMTKLLSISEDKFTAAKSYICSSGATPEEIDCFEAKDDASAEEIKNALQNRIDSLKKTFKDYNPEQAPKLDSPVLIANGKYVFLCISGDNNKAKEIIG